LGKGNERAIAEDENGGKRKRTGTGGVEKSVKRGGRKKKEEIGVGGGREQELSSPGGERYLGG